VRVADTGLPGRNLAPPEAKKIVPLKSTAWPNVTLKLVMPTRRSSNSNSPPKLILPVPPRSASPQWRRRSSGGGRARLVDQQRLADVEAVRVDDEARRAVARVDLARDAERVMVTFACCTTSRRCRWPPFFAGS